MENQKVGSGTDEGYIEKPCPGQCGSIGCMSSHALKGSGSIPTQGTYPGCRFRL